MSEVNKEKVLTDVTEILDDLTSDWEFDDEISGETLLYKDLGFESIDAVALGTAVEEHYNQPLPFAEFLTELGEKNVEDLSVNELVEFIHQNLDTSQLGE